MSKKTLKTFIVDKQFNEILNDLRADLGLTESATVADFNQQGLIQLDKFVINEVDERGRVDRVSRPLVKPPEEKNDHPEIDNPYVPHVGDLLTMHYNNNIAVSVVYKVANDKVYYKNIRYPLLVNEKPLEQIYLKANPEKMKSYSYGKSFAKFGVGNPDLERNDFITNFKLGKVSEDWLPQ